MKTNVLGTLAVSCLTLLLSADCSAVDLLTSGDFIIAIDVDPGSPDSDYPGGEDPLFALDGDPGTKYLNYGKLNTGFIATPFTSSTVQSIQFTTANDAPARDPLTYDLYGTNDPITSMDNSFGDQETWSLINSGLTGLDVDPGRLSTGPFQDFTNSTAYSSYRIVFPTIRDANNAGSMQIADVGLFTGAGGSGSQVFNFANDIVAIGLNEKSQAASPGGQGPDTLIDDFGGSSSNYPGGEGPGNVVDGTFDKYLNRGGTNSGFIVTPSFGSAIVQSFKLTSANDFEGRDPASWELYGTNDSIVSTDNSFGTAENWTIVDSGSFDPNGTELPLARDTLGDAVTVTNSTAYSSYKMLFPTLRTPNDPLMQIAEASFFESTDGTGFDLLNPGDPILAIDEDSLLGTQTTHVNFGGENSGFIVTPSKGESIIEEFQITTGGDEPSRDPTSWELYGTNDTITSEPFSFGDQENWVLIDSGTLDPEGPEIPLARHTTGDPVSVNNSTAYTSYRMVFPTNRDPLDPQGTSIQMAQINFSGVLTGVVQEGDFDGDGDVDGNDFLVWQRGSSPTGPLDAGDLSNWQTNYGATPSLTTLIGAVPEPSAVVLVLFGLIGASTGAARRVARGRATRRWLVETGI